MEKYILFEFEGYTLVAKKTPFTKEERLNGFFFYDLSHPDEDDYFPYQICREGKAFNYWGSIMSSKPIEDVHSYGVMDIGYLELDENDEYTIDVPNPDFVTNIHFYDYSFYVIETKITTYLGFSIDFHSILSVWECIEPFSYPIEDLEMSRSWNMPNKNTFDMKVVSELLKEEINGGLVVDPFANKNQIAHLTNDLNTRYDTNFNKDALDFLRMFEDESVDVVLFDPPYSPRQIKEAYESVGLDTQGGMLTRASYWSDLKREITRILRVKGKVISFGWNSNGMGNKDVFHVNRILLVAHGGNHNDTIITVSVKKKPMNSFHFIHSPVTCIKQEQLTLF